MSLGKPAIVTAWSGNMDYCTSSNSMLVEYTLVPVSATHDAYQPHYVGRVSHWAEPSVDSAAASMRQLASSEELRLSLGRSALRDMERLRDTATMRRVIEAVREQAAAVTGPAAARHRAVALATWRRSSLAFSLKRVPSALMRRLRP
jgi:hypothetical protein